MKKALLIVVVVAAYSAIETALVLSVMAPNPLIRYPDTLQIVVIWGQFLFIPGMVALMSRIMYGPYQWQRRTLSILLLGGPGLIVVPLAAMLLLAIPIVLLAWVYDLNRILFTILWPVVVGGVLWTFVFLVRKSGKWAVRAETERWLAERQAGTSQCDRTWRNRGIRLAVCIPSLIALTIFLFLPETWGLVSHLCWPQCGMLSGYKVTLPANWVVLYCQSKTGDGRSHVNGVVGRGIGSGGSPLRYDSMASWMIETKSTDDSNRTDYHRWQPKPGDILERRTITIRGSDLECIDYWPSDPWAMTRSATIAHVDCSSAVRLHATFDGARQNLGAFYRMLEGITETK